MARTKDDFVVVLPSNSNLDTHPKNRPDEYEVRLFRGVDLQGDWEVALLNIQYPHNWFDVVEKTTIHWMYTSRRTTMTAQDIAYRLKLGYQVEFKTCVLELLSPDDADYRHSANTIWPGHFSSAQEFGDYISRTIENNLKAAKLRQTPSVKYSFDFETRAGSFHTSYGTLLMFTSSTYLPDLLGIKADAITPREIDDISAVEIPQLYMFGGPSKSNFAKIDSIYVYTDVVKPQLVGDVEAKLLGIIPVRMRSEETQFFSFDQPLFLPVKKTSFSTITIKLRSSRGQAIPFPKYSKEVIVTLKFRRRKHYM